MPPVKPRALTGAVIVAALIAIVLVSGGDKERHKINLVVANAFQAIPGERMVEGGTTVGQIESTDVTKDGKAHLVLGIEDSAWPLPADTKLTLRMGGTIKYTDRYIEITRGTAKTDLAEDASVPSARFVVPLEYDSLFNVFDKQTRAGLGSLLTNAAPAVTKAAQPFRRAVGPAAPAVEQADAVFRDLTHDQEALSTLVSSTAGLTRAVAQSNPGVRTLIDGGAGTFTALASQSTQIKRVLDSAAPAFRTTAKALGHTSRSLESVADLADRLDSGIEEVRAIGAPLSTTLQRLLDVAPSATSTLTTIRRSEPDVSALLSRTRTTLMPRLESIGKQAATQLNCIRPWTPELISFMQGWGGFFARGLTKPKIHILHGMVSVLPFPNTIPLTTKQLSTVLPTLKSSFPQVPGEDLNQPQVIPECGYTEKNLDPAHDPESGTYNPNGSKIVPYPTK